MFFLIYSGSIIPQKRKAEMGPDPKKIKALEDKMTALGISREDIVERFIKSSGRGGQKVNKSSSAVFLKHEKTGISVKVGKHRSQHLNRFLALRTLVEKIEIQKRDCRIGMLKNWPKYKSRSSERRGGQRKRQNQRALMEMFQEHL